MEHTMRGDSLQREIIEGRMDGKRGKPRQKLMDWMMSEGYSKLKEEAKHREHGTIGGMDLPEGRELNEEVIENSKNNYAATMASAARRQIIGGGGAAGARLYFLPPTLKYLSQENDFATISNPLLPLMRLLFRNNCMESVSSVVFIHFSSASHSMSLSEAL